MSINRSVGAVVVAYQPVKEQISRLLSVLSRECECVYVMDNGGAADCLGDLGRIDPAVRVVGMDGNRGIGAALSAGFERVKEAGARFVVTFDQDSTPQPGMVTTLMNAFERLESSGLRVGAVGPRLIDARNVPSVDYPLMRRIGGWPRRVSCDEHSEFTPVDYVITSGCLTSLAVYDQVGGFEQSFFIDGVDLEWCFRAASIGYGVYVVCPAIMAHELGENGASKAFGITISRHSPLRRYYYARNTVRLAGMRHVPWGWKLRMIAGLLGRVLLFPFVMRFEAGWSEDWRMLTCGLAHGMVGQGGIYKHS